MKQVHLFNLWSLCVFLHIPAVLLAFWCFICSANPTPCTDLTQVEFIALHLIAVKSELLGVIDAPSA